MKQKAKGFTLIELLIVLAIIGLLATIVLASLNNSRIASRDAKRVSDIKQYMAALELYYNVNNSYPSTAIAQVMAPGLPASGVGLLVSQNYISQFQAAPVPPDGGCTQAQNNYSYQANSGNPNSYRINFCISKPIVPGNSGGPPYLRSALPNGIQ